MSTFLRYNFVAIITVGLIAAGSLSGCQEVERSDSQPNIIYILADDLGYGDLGSYGQTKFDTPNLDRLASEGMRFTSHYSGSTVCAPSRAVLMTGLHTGHAPVRGNMERLPIGQYPIPYAATTVAEVLKDAGYATGAFGKWGLGYPGSEGSPSYQGFDLFFGYNGQRRAHYYYPEFLFREVPGQAPERVPLEGNEVVKSSDENARHPGSGPPINKGVYSQDVIVEEALAFIERHADESNPFFAYLPLNIPHASMMAPEKAFEAFRDSAGNSIFEENPSTGGHYTDQAQPRAAFAAMVTLLDGYVGAVMDRVEKLGIADNTVIMFTSDNGPHLEGGHDPEFFDSNGPLRGFKRDLYEGGIRVPLIARWKGTIPAGTTSDHISAFEDMMPTFAELAGAPTPAHIDGISMVPELTRSGEQPVRDYLYWEFPARGGKQAVRMGDWKAVRLQVNSDPDGPLELYNLAEDPGEQENIADQHPDRVREMEQVMTNARVKSELFPLGEE